MMDQPAGTVAAVRAGLQGTPAAPGGAFTMCVLFADLVFFASGS
jgi:hypothetical protein